MIYKQKRTQNSKKKLLIIILGIILLISIIIAILELTNTTHFFHDKAVTPRTVNQYTKGEQATPSTGTSTNQTPTDDREGDTFTNTKGQSDTPPSPSESLKTPTGNFVSAHRVPLEMNPPLQSSCETTPKATCEISFTKGNTVIRLKAQTTDDGGATYWTWKPKDIGLTTGSWKVQAKAQLGNSTLTADDALTLEVTQ